MEANTQKYNWKEVKEKILNGVSYVPSNPFAYRHQIRIKLLPTSIIYTYWNHNKCVLSGSLQNAEISAWEELFGILSSNKILEIPCVSVGISLWNDLPMLVRPENSAAPLDMVNKALREQPERIRKDLQINGIYGFTAIPCDASRLYIFGLPLGYPLKGALAKFPATWAKFCWYGPAAVAFKDLPPDENLFHTVLLRNVAVSLVTYKGKLRFILQDKILTENQTISQGSLSRIKSVYSYFERGELNHRLYQVEVGDAWVANLKSCIQGLGSAGRIDIIQPPNSKIANVPDGLFIQDLFPGGMPNEA